MSDRTEQLRHGLAVVRTRIAAAADAVGRDPDSVTLIVVSKTWPADDVRRLADLGVTDVAENRDQEAVPKVQACADLDLTWHFVGQLQRNKAASVARYADVVQSVDREALVAALDRGAARAGRRLGALVQVGLDTGADAHRGGCAPLDLPAVAGAIEDAEHLDLLGLMAVAPLGADPAPAFARLAGLRDDLVARFPGAEWMSAGMSGDLEQAVAAGATHVRVGSAVLGGRPDVR